MTGSQCQKTSRVTSSSPGLNYTSCNSPRTKKQEPFHWPNQKSIPDKHKNSPVKVPMTPVRPGKRSHQAIVSPITTRTESSSPKAKFRTLSSPVALSPSSSIGSFFSSPTAKDNLSILSNDLNGLGNSLAVPKVSAEPPNPSLLPSPPKHWVGEKDAQCLAKKQQCREVTQCLVTHLASSGILVSAQ